MQNELETENALYRKVTFRIVPFLFCCYILNILNRVNVNFAKLQMLDDLKFSETVYGLGAGIFFIGYIIFEVPSNLIMQRIGAKVWIAIIMALSGLISTLTMFITSPSHYYLLRFLLGVAEAGFVPGIILYLTYWYPAKRRGVIMATFMSAIVVSSLLGSPLSGWIMERTDQINDLSGWQWLFLLEGLPTIFIAMAVPLLLTNNIQSTTWLNENEKTLLQSRVTSSNSNTVEHKSFLLIFKDRKILTLGILYLCICMPVYGIMFFLPTFIKESGVQDLFNIGLFSSIPYSIALVMMFAFAFSADNRCERRWHLIIPLLIGAIGLLATLTVDNNIVLSMLFFSIVVGGIITSLSLFWSLPTAFLKGTSAAAGIAIINSMGNLGGFIAPYAIGLIKDVFSSSSPAIGALALLLLCGAVITYFIPAKLVNG